MKLNIKSNFKRITSACLAAAMCACLWVYYPENAVQVSASASISQKQDQLAALEKQKQELANKINSLSSEQKKQQSYKQDLDYLVSTVNSKIETANALVAELEEKVKETEADITAHEELIKQTTEKFKERMRANHEAGAENYFSILVGAADIGDFLSRVERVNAMLEYDKNLQKQYKAEKEELEKQRDDLIASKVLQEKTLETLKKDKEESERLSKEAESYINALQADKAQYQQQYNAAKAAEEALDREITAILQSLQNQNSQQQTASGAYMWPLPTGRGYISCHFGDTDPAGRPHYAVDVAQIGMGCPIYAANSGTVVKAEWHYSYGYYVLIDHGGGIATLYAHCSSLSVSAGQSVSKGQTIAGAGTTGFSTGVHLHFEFRVNGQKVNALNYVAAGC
ncbi:MAG: peptidoglycan DD-metalloendopeptidase family protein [Clostridia bacterium]|nr:peptidoglycan DD-metalloendopeptidase family protein [Clostridia bacterium]